MAIDLRAWLTEIGVAADKIDTVLPIIEPTAANIEKATLRQSDYSRVMNDVRTQQTALDAANQRVNNELLEVAEMRAAGEPITAKMRTDLENSQAEVARLSSRLNTLAVQAGIDPATIVPVQAPPQRTDAQAVDLSGYVKTDEVNRQLGQFADYFVTFPAELQSIAQEHFDLTGERLDARTIAAEIRTRAGDKHNRRADGTLVKPVDARSIWEEKHDIATKRAAKATSDMDARLNAAREEGRQQVRTEAALPGATPIGHHAPVFKRPGDAQAPKTPRPSQSAHNDRISGAAAAIATHRYRPAGTPQPGGAR